MTAAAPQEFYRVNALAVLAALLRSWRLFFGLAVLGGGIAATYGLLVTRRYTAHTAFIPEGQRTTTLSGGLASLATQFGITGDPSALSQSPLFYEQLLRSRELETRLLHSRFTRHATRADAAADSAPLLSLLRVKGATPALRLDNGVQRLRRQVAVSVDRRTGIVSLDVTTDDPVLSAAVAERYLSLVNEFNLQKRQLQARARRVFSEGRLAQASRRLREAEDAMRRFYEANRQWQSSPNLQFEEARLRRQVAMEQDLYLSLRREVDAAQIAEVNDTPLITIVDHPVPPARKSWPRVKLLGLQGVALGLVLALAALLGRMGLAAAVAENPDAYTEVREQIRGALRMRSR